MNNLMSASFYKNHHNILNNPLISSPLANHAATALKFHIQFQFPCRRFRYQASTSSELDNIDNNVLLKESKDEEEEEGEEEIPDPNAIGVMQASQNQQDPTSSSGAKTSSANAAVDKDLKKVVQKTAATFAPRASVASKNPAVPGTTLYTVFEVQAYASLFLGGALSFNLIFPSNDPDIWRLMGMWSIWMFTIPSLRARDCSKNEKEALNYLFLLVPLLNVTIPFFWKSFAVVWSADTVAFFAMYAWKLGWLQKAENE